MNRLKIFLRRLTGNWWRPLNLGDCCGWRCYNRRTGEVILAEDFFTSRAVCEQACDRMNYQNERA